MAPRLRRGNEVKARVTDDLKAKVLALAATKGDDENESLVVREALTWYFRQPEVAKLIDEGRRLLAERDARRR